MRRRRTGRLAFCATLAVAVVGILTTGCGSSETQATENAFGDSPSPAAGVRAWAAGETGALLVTTDGGANWKKQSFFLSGRAVDVVFTDARTGWIATDAGTVLATTDGGSQWKVVAQVKLEIKAIAAADARTAWVIGSAAGSNGATDAGTVLATTDGGATWRRRRFGDAMLADVAFASTRRGVLVALDRIWSTRDGGRTWRLRRRLPMTVLTSVAVAGPRRFRVAGWGTQEGTPVVYASDSAGKTWRRLRVDVPAPAAGVLQSRQIACAGASHLWITCDAGVLASSDGGATWELQETAAGKPQAIAAADRRHVLATTDGQAILVTDDGGATWLAFGKQGFLEQSLVAITAISVPAE